LQKRSIFAANILFQKDMQLSEILKDSDYRHAQFVLMLVIFLDSASKKDLTNKK
jgi:hypothetical protein